MRRYIFTQRERRLLERWLEIDEEDQVTRKLFVQIRRNTMPILKDVELLLRVRWELRRRGRWKRRLGSLSKSEFASRLGVSASTLRRNGRNT